MSDVRWVLHLRGKNTPSGNPVRVWVELTAAGGVKAWAEDYSGMPEHLRRLDNLRVFEIDVPNAEVKRIVKRFQSRYNLNPAGGKFDNAITEAVYNALNAGAVTVDEGWERGDGGEWMFLLNTDRETVEEYADDSQELHFLLGQRNRYPVMRDGTMVVFLSGDELGRVHSYLFRDYQEGRDYWAREMRNMDYEEEDDDDEDGDE